MTPTPMTAEKQRPQPKPVASPPSQLVPPRVEAQETIPRPAPAQPPYAAAPLIDDPGRADRTKEADNTRINARDREGGTVTPGDQGNSRDETQITAAIRREMMSDKTLSFTAKNAKIITTGKTVTLRGAVKTEAERAIIEAIARHTAGVGEVVNQLEVKK